MDKLSDLALVDAIDKTKESANVIVCEKVFDKL